MSPDAGKGVGAGVSLLGEEVDSESVRQNATQCQNEALLFAAGARQLKPMERLVLLAYVDAQAAQGARVGRPGVCWPADAQVAAFLGTTVLTVRRARRELAAHSFIRTQHVVSLHRLPDGQPSPHGAIVVTVLGMVPRSSGGANTGNAAKGQSVAFAHCPTASLSIAA